MITLGVLRVGNAHWVYVKNLQDPLTRAYDLEAELSFTLLDASGAEVSGAVDIDMPLIVGSTTGDYRGLMPGPGTVTLTEGATYTVVITDSTGSLKWDLPYIAAKREK